jgi:hypothetical protein
MAGWSPANRVNNTNSKGAFHPSSKLRKAYTKLLVRTSHPWTPSILTKPSTLSTWKTGACPRRLRAGTRSWKKVVGTTGLGLHKILMKRTPEGLTDPTDGDDIVPKGVFGGDIEGGHGLGACTCIEVEEAEEARRWVGSWTWRGGFCNEQRYQCLWYVVIMNCCRSLRLFRMLKTRN